MITLKEEWLTEEKTERAIELGGEGVVRMWLALKSYAARKLTDGFVPDEAIDTLRGAPKRPRRLLQALVDCGLQKPDGSRGSGLVDKVEHGWQLHDYLDHAVSADEETERREKERRRKQTYRAIKRLAALAGVTFDEVRRRFPGDADAEAIEDLIEGIESGDMSWDSPGTNGRDNVPGQRTGQSRGTSRAGTPSGARTRDARARPRAPQPSPAQPSPGSDSGSLKAAAKDLTGSGTPTAPEQRQPEAETPNPETRVRCPVPVPVPGDTLAMLAVNVGLPEPVSRAFLADWSLRQNAKANDLRTVDAWCASGTKALTSEWTRDKAALRALAERPDEGAQKARQAALQAQHEARIARLDAEAREANARRRAAGEHVPDFPGAGTDVQKLVEGIGG